MELFCRVSGMVHAGGVALTCAGDIERGTKKKIYPSNAKTGPAILSVAVSDDGTFVAAAGEDTKVWFGPHCVCVLMPQVHVMDMRSGAVLDPLGGHRGLVSGLAFRRNSHELFSSSFDRTARVWNLDEMAYVESLYGHYSEITCIDSLHKEVPVILARLLLREQRAVSCGVDRTVRLWKVVDETQLIFRYCRRVRSSCSDAVTGATLRPSTPCL